MISGKLSFVRAHSVLYMAVCVMMISQSFAQNCKYKRNGVDEFTKDVIKETKQEGLSASMGFSFSYTAMNINGKHYLNVHLSGLKLFAVNDGSQIMFKPEDADKESIVLKFSEYGISNGIYNSVLKMMMHSLWTIVPISDENFERLKTEKVNKIRVYFTEGYADDDISSKRASKFQQQLKCVE